MQPTTHLVDAALQVLSEAVVITDIDRIIRYINPAACQLLDVLPDNILGQPLRLLPGGSGLLDQEQTTVFYERINYFALLEHKIAMPPPDTQGWSIMVGDRSLYFRAVPLWQVEERIGILLQIRNETLERTAEGLLEAIFSESVNLLGTAQGYSDLLIRVQPIKMSEQQQSWIISLQEAVKKLKTLRERAIEQYRTIAANNQRPLP